MLDSPRKESQRFCSSVEYWEFSGQIVSNKSNEKEGTAINQNETGENVRAPNEETKCLENLTRNTSKPREAEENNERNDMISFEQVNSGPNTPKRNRCNEGGKITESGKV